MHAAAIGPSGSLIIGETSTNFDIAAVPGTKLSQLSIDMMGSSWSVEGQATVNPDPFIDYGFTIKNFGASPLNFTLILATPFTGGPYSLAKSSHSGSITDSEGQLPMDGAVSVVAAAGGLHQPAVDGNPFGAIAGGCSDAGVAGDSFYCGIGNLNGLAISTGPTGMLSVTLSGTLSAGDVYTFNGLARIYNLPGDNEIPEPATMGMAAAAFGALVLVRRYRKAA